MKRNIIGRMVFLVMPLGQSAFSEKRGMNLGARLGKALARKLGYDLDLHAPAVMLIESACYSYVVTAINELLGFMDWDQPKYPRMVPKAGITRKMIIEALDQKATGLLEEQQNGGKNVSDVFVTLEPQDLMKLFRPLCEYYHISLLEFEVDISKAEVWAYVFDLKAKTAEIVMPARTATRYK